MRHFRIHFKPDSQVVNIHGGATLLEAAGQAGIILNTSCGGQGTCGKCIVIIEPDEEKVKACEYKIESNLTVRIPEESRFYVQKILTETEETEEQAQIDFYKKYERKAEGGPIAGAAIDIGTTTVVVKLVDMQTGRDVAIEAGMNPQAKYGDDVISRINYAKDEDKLEEMNKLVVKCINELIGKCLEKAEIESDRIFEAVVVGNTAMNHFFLKEPVTELGKAPYKPQSIFARDMKDTTGLKINSAGNVYTAGLIAGFVGADTLSAALASGIGDSEEMSLLVDIGTNGEIVMGNRKKLLAASCAAGPAFEGARIQCGSRAVEGAIESVVMDEDDIDIDIIGNVAGRSICGSGLLDAIAVLAELGVVDWTGRFDKPKKPVAKIMVRMTESRGEPAFILSRSESRIVYISQQDVRQFQLAKAAVRAGIKMLQKKLGIEDSDIERIYLAGAFGNYLRRESALRTGLLPAVEKEKIIFIGNAALSGAKMMLLSKEHRKQSNRLAKQIEYVELAGNEEFGRIFADSMRL